MNMTLIKYRTKDVSHNRYAVVPTSWAPDLLEWLVLSESATIVEKTDNVDSRAIIPTKWPCCALCYRHLRISDLLIPVR